MANFNIDYLIVAGGGAGGGSALGNFAGGGGGAGGVRTSFTPVSTPANYTILPALSASTGTSYSITVGAGGIGVAGATTKGGSGANSVFETITATGGGGGGVGQNDNGLTGGSAGGTAPTTSTRTNSVSPTQGFRGGGAAGGQNYGSGGGGGGGAEGVQGTNSKGGNGGIGFQTAITGTATYYAGGGGGGSYKPPSGATSEMGLGGLGGGGDALVRSVGEPGTNGLGGGGGAATNGDGEGGNRAGGDGGSGIVILRYATADANYTTTGITPTETTDGTDTILSFTAVGTGTITFSTPPSTSFSGTKVTTPVTDFNKPLTEEGLKIPSGTSSNQPIGVEGMIRNDTTQSSGGSSSAITYYNGTNWRYFENELNTSFNTVLYTGTSSTNAITSVGFQPDLIWVKSRSGAFNHMLTDSINGGGNFLIANAPNALGSNSSAPTIDQSGFTLGAGNSNWNNSSYTYVAWCFKAGGLTNKAADFNGSSSRIDINSLANVLDAQNIVSTSFWFKSTSTSLSGLFSYRGSASSAVNMLVALNRSATGDIGLDSSTSSGFINLGNYNGGYNDGNWHHVVSVINYTTGSFNVYIDNTLRITGTNASILKGVSNKVQLGANYSAQYLNGSIGQARLFTSAISASQVTELYNETATDNSVLNFPNGAGCIAAYPLGENANGIDGLYNGTASNITFNRPGYLTRNTEGTIESTVSVNNYLGFSVVKYTATGVTATVGHGLDAPAEMIIAKTTNQPYNWIVYHKDSGASNYLMLNSSNTETPSSAFMNNTSPTSSVFTAGAGQNLNYANGDQIVAYNFASKPNYSKVGSYLGNGNTTGPVVTLGFEPAWVMIKGVDEVSGWTMLDNKRDTSNPNSARLDADDSMAEYNGVNLMDFNSDGFQLKTSSAGQNALNKTFIYLAFANTI